MPRKGENIYKRRDGRWEGRILEANGKYRYVYAKTYREVRDKKKTLQEQPEAPEKKRFPPCVNASGLLEQWLQGGLSERLKPSTYENYFRCMHKYVIPFFESAGDAGLTELQIAQFLKTIHDNRSISQSYKRKILSIFKTALREISKATGDYTQLAEAIKLPKAEPSSVQVFSIREQRLIESAVFHFEDRRAMGILLCFYSGIRLGELCALRWSDVDFEAGTMSIARTVSRTKNFGGGTGRTALVVGMPKSRKSVRKIPLPDFLLKLSGDYKACDPDDGRYILSDSDTPIDPRTYQKLFKKILAVAGVKDRKFHAIRHTFATRALELGVDIKTLSEILGHANVSVTLNIYAHSLMEQKKIAIEKFNDMHMTHMDTFAV